MSIEIKEFVEIIVETSAEKYEKLYITANDVRYTNGSFCDKGENYGKSQDIGSWDVATCCVENFSKAFETLCQYLYKCNNNPSIRTNQKFPRIIVFMRNASFNFCPKEHSEILKEIYEAIKEVLEKNNKNMPKFLLSNNDEKEINMTEQYENFLDIEIQLSKGGPTLSIRPKSVVDNNNSDYIEVHVISEGYKDGPNNVSGFIDIKHIKDFSKAFENLCQYLYEYKESCVRNFNLPYAIIYISYTRDASARNGSIGFNLEDRPEILKEIYKIIKEVLEMNNIKIPEFLLTSNN